MGEQTHYIPENERLDTHNDALEKVDSFKNMAIFGINSLDFWGVITTVIAPLHTNIPIWRLSNNSCSHPKWP